ncbi:hypothetical protein SDC9_99706 [bioreactor metagenome]|uniref:Uncharacterized protein n=1 Tax=bioreactor metagenome TaxID=1076179 RepID=A0A645AI93_9ZZZZ
MKHLTVLDKQHPLGMAGRLDAVGHHENGLPLPVNLTEQPQQVLGGAGIQRACRLVCQDELRLCDERPGHGGALLFAAGHLIGEFPQQTGDAQLFGHGRQARLHIRIMRARQHQRQQNVIPQREGVQQIKILKHKAEVIPAEGGQLPLAYHAQAPAAQQHLAAGGLIQGG